MHKPTYRTEPCKYTCNAWEALECAQADVQDGAM